jgi:hypothetical protein
MSATPFVPADGEMSRRQRVYEAIRGKPTDELIPYSSLPFGKEIIGGLREQVAKTMEREEGRTVVVVRGQGWKIIQGTAHASQATLKRQQATRKLGRAVQLIESVDRNDMTAEEQVRADKELIAAITGYGVLRGLANKRPTLEIMKEWEKENRQ